MKTIAFAFALSATLLASNAQAAAGSVGFDGYITPSTCAVAVNGQGEHGAVTLKPVGWEKLQNAGDFAGDTPFTITLTGCGESGAPAWVRPKFASTGVNPATGNLRNQSGDGNSDIEIQLRNGTYATIDLMTNENNSPQVADSVMTFDYHAHYYRAGTTGTVSGRVTAKLEFSVEYI
ncbi:fimbrial protein [Pseudomonas citronellolis]|uniref:Fimbrial protein n=1 Tax=Pseudomonas citronellolis TaxID=53408 RepID=A0AAW6P0U9_9PSED|nr:fimbrial protein [Pseudomonas citronellolis]MDF3841125.1 fimbrial protein [Pseudomonas citronellolis]